jgi:hypothetical protein
MTMLDIQIKTSVKRTGSILLNEAELLALLTKALGEKVPHDLSIDNFKWDIRNDLFNSLEITWTESEPDRVELQEVLL